MEVTEEKQEAAQMAKSRAMEAISEGMQSISNHYIRISMCIYMFSSPPEGAFSLSLVGLPLQGSWMRL